jgi:hypothetical protein
VTGQQKLILIGLCLSVLMVYGLFYLVLSSEFSQEAQFAAREAIVIAQEPSPLPTRTLRPTFTSTPIPTDTPTSTPTFTVTPTPTFTPVPTDTPVPPTNTPKPVAPKPTQPPPTEEPTATPVPDVDFRLVKVRRLSACENHGNHNIYINVLDKDGNGLPWIKVWVSWGPEGAELETGHKPEMGDGYVDFPMFKGTHTVQVMNARSEIAQGITPDIPQAERCEETGEEFGNSLYHYSYEVVFQRTW